MRRANPSRTYDASFHKRPQLCPFLCPLCSILVRIVLSEVLALFLMRRRDQRIERDPLNVRTDVAVAFRSMPAIP